jgi:hypothetical protein
VGDGGEGLDQSRNGAKQADQRGDVGERPEKKKSLEKNFFSIFGAENKFL